VHCYNILRNSSDADDLTQETFCKAYSALPRTTETLALSVWLYRIASNACTDLLRRRRTARWLPLDEYCYERPSIQREDNPETAFFDTEALQRFGMTCGAMSPRNCRALTLRAKDGLSVEQIGAHLGITTPAVKSLLFRARGEVSWAHRRRNRSERVSAPGAYPHSPYYPLLF
jgi:RNA polymerase sigma-70 factor (ECF subfamily)